MKFILRVLLTQRHKVLLRFNRTNLLDETSSGTEDEGRRNIVKLARSERMALRTKTRRKITRAFRAVEGKLLV